jgi:recombination protein RecA
MGMATMGMQARLMSQALRKLTAILSRARPRASSPISLREKVGVHVRQSRDHAGRQGAEVLRQRAARHSGARTCQGSRPAPSWQSGQGEDGEEQSRAALAEAEFEIIYNHGINKEGSNPRRGPDHGVVEKKGAWLQFNGDLIGRARTPPASLDRQAGIGKQIVDAIMAKARPRVPVEK